MAIAWEFDKVGSIFDEADNSRTTYSRIVLGRGIVTPATDIPGIYREIYDDPGLPARGDPLDVTSWPNLKCLGRRVDAIQCLDSGTVARMTLTYQNFSSGFSPIPDDNGPVIVTSNESTVVFEPTILDNTGNIITVEHDGKIKTAPVDWGRPVANLEASRIESSDPRARASDYVGKVNNGLWNGYPARTVLCEGIVASTSDGGDSFEVTYRFTYRLGTWDQLVWWENDEGKPEVDIVNGVGYKKVEVYDEINFGPLNITL